MLLTFMSEGSAGKLMIFASGSSSERYGAWDMFWKTKSEKRRRPPASLALRLSVWYAGSSFLMLLVVTGSLYWMLVRSFDRENDQYLAEKLTILETLLRDRPGRLDTVEWEVEGESRSRPSLRVLSSVLSDTSGVINETEGMSRELPQTLLASSSFSNSEPQTPREIRSANGRTFRALVARVRSPSSQNYTVEGAVDLTYQQDLLAF